MNKKGFTLVELIATLLVLGIISLIAVPIVGKVIKSSKRKLAESSVNTILKSANIYINELALQNDGRFPEESIIFECSENGCVLRTELEDFNLNNLNSLNIKGVKPSSGNIMISNYGKEIIIEGMVVNDYHCSYENGSVKCGNDLYVDSILNGADPVMDDGMIPIIINEEDGSITKADIKEKWYDYANKMWANIVLVKADSRSKYQNAAPGTSILTNDILAYYVWVPRYKYQIFSDISTLARIETISATGGLPDNYENKAQLINIVFENRFTTKSNGSNKDEWLTHPAFTFGTTELNGFWVAKYETSGTTTVPTSLPNKTSLRDLPLATCFTTSKNLNYGTNRESTVIKNSEWGAVAYLSSSIYGQGTTEIRINNSANYTTGCAATVRPITTYGGYNIQTDHSEGTYWGCENQWYTTIGREASTTGTVYGIYDMNGGAAEFVMGLIEDEEGSKIPSAGKNHGNLTGFAGKVTYPDPGEEIEVDGMELPDPKYYDVYDYNTVPQTGYINGKLGDATIEMGQFVLWLGPSNGMYQHSSWHQDYARFPYNANIIFIRGGIWYLGQTSGIFSFDASGNNIYGYNSFRVVLR